MTTVVVVRTSSRDGVVTLRISLRTSRRKSVVLENIPVNWLPGPESCPRSANLSATFALVTALSGCGLCFSSRIAVVDFAITFLLPEPQTSGPITHNSRTGRGGGIRTPKFGFGDRQFNR